MSELRHAWLQKHPTPLAAAGEFHWYPAASSPDEAALRGWVVEQVQGLAAPSVWWELAPGRVLWASVFSAVSPVDARPYRGVALTILEGTGEPSGAPSDDASAVAALLARLRPASPAPWSPGAVEAAALDDQPASAAPPLEGFAAAWCHPPRLARAVLAGGAATVEDPHEPALPRRLAPLAALLPPELARHPRSGQLRRASDAAHADERKAGADPLAALCAAAWHAEGLAGQRARAAWSLLVELAYSEARLLEPRREPSLEEDLLSLEDALARSDEARARAVAPAELERWLDDDQRASWRRCCADPPASWQRLLHGWGRGWLDGAAQSRGAALLPHRFAEELAFRALAALRAGGETAPLVAEARWHALLPAAHRRALLTALVRCAPSLFAESLGRRPVTDEPPPSSSPWRSREESVDVA